MVTELRPQKWSVRFKDLRQKVREGGVTKLTYLPLLGRTGYIHKGFSHIIGAYPKVGKTTLMRQLVKEWPDEQVLYFSEEGELIWELRADEAETAHEEEFDNLQIEFAMGMTPDLILNRIKSSKRLPYPPTVIVIDTIRTAIRPEDENDNAKVEAALRPYVQACRDNEQTLIMLHHTGKTSSGASGGRGIAGAHSFLGVMDVGFEYYAKNRQRWEEGNVLTGQGRFLHIRPMVIREAGDGVLYVAEGGDEMDAVKDVVNASVDFKWQTTAEIADKHPALHPNKVRTLLKELAEEGVIERDPDIRDRERNTSGMTLHWRRL